MFTDCKGRNPVRATGLGAVHALFLWAVLGWGPGEAMQAASMPQSGYFQREKLDPRVALAIAGWREEVPELMQEGKIPGCALALVDREGILWMEGFGYADEDLKTPVTPETLFLIGSISKAITATAAMVAVQEGLIGLDDSITNTWPGFHVNSRYEEGAGDSMTLRHLLGHTSGLPPEVTVGNVAEPFGTFEEHVRSVLGCWLVHPVGQAYYDGDVDADVTAHLLERVYSKPFPCVLGEELFQPLGMRHSTVDYARLAEVEDRARGHTTGMVGWPEYQFLIGSGGAWSSAKDLALFIQMHLNRGEGLERRLLSEALADEMVIPRGRLNTEREDFHALGLYVGRRAGEARVIYHDGGGVGFLSVIHWYPDYGIGAVALMNRWPNSQLETLGCGLTDRLINGGLVQKRPDDGEPAKAEPVAVWQRWSEHRPTPYRAEWERYEGEYRFRVSGYRFRWWLSLALRSLFGYPPQIEVAEQDGYLAVTESKFFERIGVPRHVDERLQELEPGLFSAPTGLTLDFRGEIPTWRNYRLER